MPGCMLARSSYRRFCGTPTAARTTAGSCPGSLRSVGCEPLPDRGPSGVWICRAHLRRDLQRAPSLTIAGLASPFRPRRSRAHRSSQERPVDVEPAPARRARAAIVRPPPDGLWRCENGAAGLSPRHRIFSQAERFSLAERAWVDQPPPGISPPPGIPGSVIFRASSTSSSSASGSDFRSIATARAVFPSLNACFAIAADSS